MRCTYESQLRWCMRGGCAGLIVATEKGYPGFWFYVDQSEHDSLRVPMLQITKTMAQHVVCRNISKQHKCSV